MLKYFFVFINRNIIINNLHNLNTKILGFKTVLIQFKLYRFDTIGIKNNHWVDFYGHLDPIMAIPQMLRATISYG